jgi:hypothetical protein
MAPTPAQQKMDQQYAAANRTLARAGNMKRLIDEWCLGTISGIELVTKIANNVFASENDVKPWFQQR